MADQGSTSVAVWKYPIPVIGFRLSLPSQEGSFSSQMLWKHKREATTSKAPPVSSRRTTQQAASHNKVRVFLASGILWQQLYHLKAKRCKKSHHLRDNGGKAASWEEHKHSYQFKHCVHITIYKTAFWPKTHISSKAEQGSPAELHGADNRCQCEGLAGSRAALPPTAPSPGTGPTPQQLTRGLSSMLKPAPSQKEECNLWVASPTEERLPCLFQMYLLIFEDRY